jgi:HEAT repeat protein
MDIRNPDALKSLQKAMTAYIESWPNKPITNLGKIGAPAVAPLIEALNHENREVRWRAAHVLRFINEPIPIEPLIDALQDEDS